MRRVAAAWRPAARLARREVRRRPWRTALVVTLIALPVTAATFAAIFVRTVTPTAAERRAAILGQADDVVYDSTAYRDADDFSAAVAAAYPEGSRIVAFSQGNDAVTKPDDHLENVSYTDQPIDERLLEGAMHVLDGRAPRSADEVAVSPEVLDHADAAVGERIELFLLGEVTVTGVVVDADGMQGALVVGTSPPTSPYDSAAAYVDTPPGFVGPDAAALVSAQAESTMPQYGDLGGSSSRGRLDRPTVIYLVGGVALVAMAIIATAAFSVAARRQLRTLGLLSASGVPPAGLRRTVLLQGSACGLVGSVVGVALGLAAAVAVAPYLNDFASDYVDALVVHPLDLVAPLVLGVTAATGAAALPAWTAGRVPVLAALAGRRPQGQLPYWVPVVGLAAVGLGVVGLGSYARHPVIGWGYGLVSSIAVLLGGCVLAPWVVAHTEPLASRLRGGARVAARDLARQRLRAGSVVAAVMVPAGLAVLAASMTERAAAQEAVRSESYEGTAESEAERLRQALFIAALEGATRSTSAGDLDEVRSILPDAAEIDVLVATTSGARADLAVVSLVDPITGSVGEPRWIAVADPDQLQEAALPDEIVEALEGGKVVVSRPSLPRQAGLPPPEPPMGRVVEPDDIVVTDFPVPSVDLGVLVAPDTAERWGLATDYYGTLFRNPDGLTGQQRDDLQEGFGCTTGSCRDQQIQDQLLGRDSAQSDSFMFLNYPDTGPDHELDQQTAAAGGILGFTLLIVAAALALASAESRDERALLDAVGATPRVRRSIAAWQAGLLPALAMVLAVPGGLAVAFAFTVGDVTASAAEFRVPWLTVGLLGLGVPLASAGAAWMVAGLSGRRRQDLSTLALAAD